MKINQIASVFIVFFLTFPPSDTAKADEKLVQTPLALPANPFQIGEGGDDGFVAVGGDGTIHVVYGGKYRSGPSSDQLGTEERITTIEQVRGVRIATDSAGQPHVVFTSGEASNAKQSYYTARIDGRWLPTEKFADAADFPECSRAYVGDVAVNEQGYALVSFWVNPIRKDLNSTYFYYRWRSPEGQWSELQSLPSHWSSAPKVAYEPGRGFYLLWQFASEEWRIAGPIKAGSPFILNKSVPTGSHELGLSIQNEGADFCVSPEGTFVVAGNVREKFEGPVGIWANVGTRPKLNSAVFLGSFPGTKRGDESGFHPVTAYDAETGTAFVTVKNRADNMAYFAVYHPDSGWQPGYTPLLPNHAPPQGTLRQGPSVADIPGPGVLVLVRDGAKRWFLRTLLPDDTTTGR